MTKEKGSRVFFEVYMKQKEDAATEQKPHPATEEIKDTEAEATEAIKTEEVRQPEILPPVQETKAEPVFSRPEIPDLTPPAYQEAERSHVPSQSLGLQRDDAPVRYDTIIYASLAAVFLCVGCFFLGHKLGYDKALGAGAYNAEPGKPFSFENSGVKGLNLKTKKPEVKKEAVKVASLKTSEATHYQSLLSKQDKWTLQIITYKPGGKNTKKATDLANTIKKETGHDAFVAKTPKGLVVCVGKFDNSNSTELRALKKQLSSFKYEKKKQFKGCYPVRLR